MTDLDAAYEAWTGVNIAASRKRIEADTLLHRAINLVSQTFVGPSAVDTYGVMVARAEKLRAEANEIETRDRRIAEAARRPCDGC